MTVYRYLGKALEIMRAEGDFRKWGPLIEKLTPEEQAEVRPWLRDRAKIAQYRQQASKPLPTSDFSKASSSGSRSRGMPKAASTRSRAR